MGRSRRKPSVVRKVVANEEVDDSESGRTSVRNGHTDGEQNSGDSSQPEEDMAELPEGTVIVQPEAVKEEKEAKFRGPEFNKSRKLTGGDCFASVTCTACAKQINTRNPGAARRHPVLQVLICKRCYKYYKSGKIAQDSNGLDEQCRWCGEGGNLICCDFCSNAFCKGCIKRNLGRAELSGIMEAGDDAEWKCYVCSPLPLAAHVEDCNTIFERIEREKKKDEIAERERKEREKGPPKKSDKKRSEVSSSKDKSEKKKKSKDDSESEDDEMESGATNGKKKSSPSKTKRGKKEDGSDEESESEMKDRKTRKQKPKSTALPKNAKSRKKSSDGEDDDDNSADGSEEYTADSSKGDKKTGRKSKPAKMTGKKKKGSDDDDDDDDEDDDGEEDTADSSKSDKERREKSKSAKTVGKKKKDSDSDDSDTEEQKLEKDIDKLSEMPSLKKKQRGSDSNVETEEDKKAEKAKKAGKTASVKKKKAGAKEEISSSSDGDDDEDMDEEAEQDDSDHEISFKKDQKTKAKEGTSPETENKKALKSLKMDLGDEESSDTSDSDDSSNSEPTPKAKRKGRRKVKQEKDSGSESDSGKVKKVKRGRKENSKSESNSDSDFVTVPRKKSKNRQRSNLLEAKLSDSDSDVRPTKRGRGGKGKKGTHENGKGKKRKRGSGSDSSDDASMFHDSDLSVDSTEEKRRKSRERRKKRRRIKMAKDSDDSSQSGSDRSGGDDDDDERTPGGKRKKIRRILNRKKLTDETKAAAKAEEDRRKRIAERQQKYNVVQEEDATSPMKCPMTTKLVLESDPETNKPLIEVNKRLVRKLKPHQVEAVQFMWECCCETLARMKKDGGAGCILAHCMGLGKTLSVISLVHTLLKRKKLTKLRTCLVVCPLNTVLNWQHEWDMWFDEDDKLDVYDLNMVKVNGSRADMLQDWQESGGILIMGYEMYRNLTLSNSRIKSKKLKNIFEETLVNPGPDIVVCDEGHILKNDATALSRAMSRIRTLRRIVLTGTPLQNNLIEYHCMVDFVKPKLLGTRKEFSNRFVNPITNGQCADSTPFDVKIMKRRAHILHDLLAGCVQRRDYSALTKFLPPKFEYVISVRLSKAQEELYRGYLEMKGVLSRDSGEIVTTGARLFSDYQYLMRIWTHPWMLKLDEIRTENKASYDDDDGSDMDSFIDDGGSGSDSSKTHDSSSSSDNDEDVVHISSDEDDKKKRKTRSDHKKNGDSDSDHREVKKEIVKEWKTRSRGGGPEEIGESSTSRPDMPEDKPEYAVTLQWWSEFVKEEDKYRVDLGGKLVLLFEILRMCEEIGDKVLVFSQSLLSLDLIEDFLEYLDKKHQEMMTKQMEEEKEKKKAKKEAENNEDKDGEKEKIDEEKKGVGEENKDGEKEDQKDGEKEDQKDGEKDEEKGGEKTADKLAEDVEKLMNFGVSWTRGQDYFRFDGSTSPLLRKQYADHFNDPENYRARLFLISTKAGSLGINLVAANRVIVFDASWNPSHDIQSIFRVYRFGQDKPVYVYRLLAQGTMEEKIYERQVTKQSLAQRVVDEHQIERHFNARDLQELYRFKPDMLDDPNRTERPTPVLPKDHMLAEMLQKVKDWIVTYHEHDSLLENLVSEELTEDERKAAWEEYEQEKKGIVNRAPQIAQQFLGQHPGLLMGQMGAQGGPPMMNHMGYQGAGSYGQVDVRPPDVMRIIQEVRRQFPNLTSEALQMHVQAVVRQQIAQQIMQQQELQRRQIELRQRQEQERLRQIQAQIQQRQQNLDITQRNSASQMVSMLANMQPILNQPQQQPPAKK